MIPPTSIDGTDITGATIDGTDVQEITVDGDVVFTAITGAFDLSNYTFDNVTLSTQDSDPTGMAFNNDGTAMFEVGESSDQFYQYSLS